MAPHRNHVEARSNRVPARQFVSETHDHKPDALGQAPADFFTGTSFIVDEIKLGLNVLQAKARALTTAHESKSATGMKLASEDLSKIANQLHLLANTVTDVSLRHINRKPRP